MRDYDVVIVGGGVVGSAIAWRLAHLQCAAAVFDKASDVVRGTSGRNSGVVHAAFNPAPGTLKARLNLEGKLLFPEYCRSLGVPFRRTGKLVVATERAQLSQLHALVERGRANGVHDLEIISGDKAVELVPGLTVHAAALSPSTAIACPFTLTIAQAESAACAGIEYHLNTEVLSVKRLSSGYSVTTTNGIVRSGAVINAAGLGAVTVARSIGLKPPPYRPVRGEYCILDRTADYLLPMPVYPLPHRGGRSLGIHLTPTVDRTVMIGPSAEGVRNREDTRSTEHVIKKLMRECRSLLPELAGYPVIHCFSGIRPAFGQRGDFIIEAPTQLPGFVNLVGIESPGLTAAPAIARMVVDELLQQGRAVGTLWPLRKSPPLPRRPLPRIRDLELDEWERLWKNDPDYGEIVCRCEKVSRAEVKRALDNPLGVRSLMGLKVRCRVTAGRCQGGFCLLRVAGEVEKKTGNPDGITLMDEQSPLFTGRTKVFHRSCYAVEETSR